MCCRFSFLNIFTRECGKGDIDITEDVLYNNSVAKLNPFRYRGYYYDAETGLYYLNSRYYDPSIGRFINADDISYIQPTDINGLNLFAYCGNNPVMYVDSGAWQFGYQTPKTPGITIFTFAGGINGGSSVRFDLDMYNGLHLHYKLAEKVNNKFFKKVLGGMKRHRWMLAPILIGVGVGLSDPWSGW